MSKIFSNYLLPAAQGINFLYTNRSDRSFAVGAHEQKGLCTLKWISSIEFFTRQAQKNISKLCSATFAKRFSYINYGAYTLMPCLYCLSKMLEGSKYNRLKQATDYIFAHLPDMVLLAGLVQSAVGLYFGVNTPQNVIQILFYVWGALEQGMSWNRPIENNGPLFTWKDGKIIRSYDKILATIYDWTYLPLSFVYGGMATRVNALSLVFSSLPSRIQSYFLPRALKKKMKDLENTFQEFAVLVTPTPKKVEKIWLRSSEFFHITDKHFQNFTITDQFPKETLLSLEKQVQEHLAKDILLKPDECKKLEELLGHLGKHGLLYYHVIGSNDEQERKTAEMNMKNIFGMLQKNWEERKALLLYHHEDFLCKAAIADTVKEMGLEIFADAQQLSETSPESACIDVGIRLILQQLRDQTFSTFFQARYTQGYASSHDLSSRLKAVSTTLLHKIRKIKYIITKDWYVSVYRLGAMHTAYYISKLALYFLQSIATSYHQVNADRVLYGKTFGLTSYEDARRDYEILKAASGIPKQFTATTGLFEQVKSKFYEPLLKRSYANAWKKILLEAIINPYDKRVELPMVINEIINIAESKGWRDEVEEPATNLLTQYIEYTQTTELTEESDSRYKQYCKDAKYFLDLYLPLVLQNLGYLTRNEQNTGEVSHWSDSFSKEKSDESIPLQLHFMITPFRSAILYLHQIGQKTLLKHLSICSKEQRA